MSRICRYFSAFLCCIFFLNLALFVPGHSEALAQTNRAAPEAATADTGNPVPTHRQQIVVAAHPMAARAGREILRAGGNAMDAAIATQMVLSVVEPQSSGIGGGGFLLYWDAAEKMLFSYDGRETAPEAATQSRFLQEDGTPMRWPDAVGTGFSIGTPGLIAMLEQAHQAHGKMPWEKLLFRAITIAEEGFGVSPRLSSLLTRMGADKFSSEARELFFDDRGEARPLGYVLRIPVLATTLKAIARNGSDAIHQGAIAQAVVAAATETGGEATLSLEDLDSYRAIAREPICNAYRGYTVCGMGPPSSGALTVAQTLAFLRGFDLGTAPNAQAIHLIIEAEKLAYADRNRYIADPDAIVIPSGYLDPVYLEERAQLINLNSTMGRAAPGTPPSLQEPPSGRDGTREAPGTTHISIVDESGNAVSTTNTIESAFGSRRMVAGFLLNNELTDFSFRPKDDEGRLVANRPGPGKRPRSSMSPTMVFDKGGKLWAVLGSPGGSRIILYVVKALVAMIDWGMDPAQAAALGTFGSRNGPAEIERDAVLDDIARELSNIGHEVARPSMTSGLHIIRILPDGFMGGADPRREGVSSGD